MELDAPDLQFIKDLAAADLENLQFIKDLQIALLDMGKEIGTIKNKISEQNLRIEKLQSENMKLKVRLNEVELLAPG